MGILCMRGGGPVGFFAVCPEFRKIVFSEPGDSEVFRLSIDAAGRSGLISSGIS